MQIDQMIDAIGALQTMVGTFEQVAVLTTEEARAIQVVLWRAVARNSAAVAAVGATEAAKR